jgi:hypothetical protein
MNATSWALVVAMHMYPQPGDPPFIQDADQIWAKIGIGGMPDEQTCQRTAAWAAREMHAYKSERFALRGVSCEPYPRGEKISAAPAVP